MITVDEALRIVRSQAVDFGAEQVALTDCLQRTLREPLTADRDFPPFDRVTMDGIAIRHEAFAAGRRRFQVKGIAAAGAPQMSLNDPQVCLEIMTGAVLPDHADTVIRYEDVEMEGEFAVLPENIEIKRGLNIHVQGSDRRRGEVIVPAGRFIRAAEIGVAATVGKPTLSVANHPRVVILSTGDELVKVEETPLPHQIRRSNSHTLQAVLRDWGLPAATDHLRDDPGVIREKLAGYLDTQTAVILSGGVSAGKYDYVPSVLTELGVENLFHKVTQRPGKPLWFGRKPGGAVVFALPGNPVSSFISTQVYFKAWWHASLGLTPKPQYAVLGADFRFSPELTYFLLVNAQTDPEGQLIAMPFPGGGSGDLAGLTDATGCLVLPPDRTDFKKGAAFPYISFQ
ncbi:MAG TPA: molybdopterin molybdotransferase MoeA [Flavilitoribacter sp.]|nr:molybdopterin molybdotransferase MoeA [Flavilitoribacter sp.]